MLHFVENDLIYLLTTYGYLAVLVFVGIESIGIPFPGETMLVTAAIYAGTTHRLHIALVIAAAAIGAILGDNIGYWIGRVGGYRLLRRYGRYIRLDEPKLKLGQYLFNKHGGKVVFFGRFISVLRTFAAFLAGVNRMEWGRFLVFNASGGMVWATLFGVGAYALGNEVRRLSRPVDIGLAVVGAVVVIAVIVFLRRNEARLEAESERAMPGPLEQHRRNVDRAVPALSIAVRRAFASLRAQLSIFRSWIGQRLDPAAPHGLVLTMWIVAGVLAVITFADLTQDVLGGDDMASVDPAVTAFVADHRVGWLTIVMKTVTWLGSGALIVPAVLATAGYLFLRRRDWRRLAQLGAAVAGAAALYEIVKPIVGRPRPPVAIQIGAEEGWAFPSGHVTQAVAFYGILAVMLLARPSLRLRVLLGIGAVLVALVVGASRLYLGVHWLTDVLGGYALGTAWLSVVMVVTLLTSSGWGTWSGAAAARPSKDSPEGAAERDAA